MNTGFGVHERPVKMFAPRSCISQYPNFTVPNGRSKIGITLKKGKGRTLTGQMKYLYRISTLVMPKPKMMVQIHAPTNPSTVFLGDSLMSWVRPKVIPQM